MADDADGPANSHIHYSIIDGNQGSPFTIDPVRGEVKVTKPLDRETVSLPKALKWSPKHGSAVFRSAWCDVRSPKGTIILGNDMLR